jgi:transposase
LAPSCLRGEASDGLLRLRPVTFGYKKPLDDGSKPVQYGLIAEEVAEVYPDLVAHTKDGQIETVQYYKLDAMLLNEVQKLATTHLADQAEIARLQSQVAEQGKQVQEQRAAMKQVLAQVSGIQVRLNDDLEQIASSDPACVRLQQIPGVGPLIATAVVSAIGHGTAFHKGREFAAWLGLVPRQCSTGGKTKLLGISKRGNPYLRKMFIHGARAAVLRVKRERSSLGKWMGQLETRAARNVVIVATANKLARISWAVLASGNSYHPLPKAAFSN